MRGETYLILGGGGMIGFQVARRICAKLNPARMVIVSLFQQEVRQAVRVLQKEFPEVDFSGFWGDVFVRSEYNDRDRQGRMRRSDLLDDAARRAELYEDLYGDDEAAYERSQLVQLIEKNRPDVIVDAINTATAISYQDIYTASRIARRELDLFLSSHENSGGSDRPGSMSGSVEALLISQYIPQLIRHVIFINKAMRSAGTRLYLKVGTTGTGGMGLNIPYTHGEDRPSAKLMSKTAVAFAHTGLLFLMARTVGGPIVKELKPAALVGWVDTAFRTIKRGGKTIYRYAAREDKLTDRLQLQDSDAHFDRLDRLKLVVADTGENGVFAKGEFETITNLRQMELITPEEIARAAALEIAGVNTGKDVIPAIDSAVMGPTYRGGYLRRQAIDDLNMLEQATGVPSVALGELGPPELSKLLWEAYLLKQVFQTVAGVLEKGPEEIEDGRSPSARARSAQEISGALAGYLKDNGLVRDTITSTGGAILLPDGQTLLRGPQLRIPERAGETEVVIRAGDTDKWARKGWIDLRPVNMQVWQNRFARMRRAKQRLGGKGSAVLDREAYLFNKIFIGEVVGWVFNNEMGGYRIK